MTWLRVSCNYCQRNKLLSFSPKPSVENHNLFLYKHLVAESCSKTSEVWLNWLLRQPASIASTAVIALSRQKCSYCKSFTCVIRQSFRRAWASFSNASLVSPRRHNITASLSRPRDHLGSSFTACSTYARAVRNSSRSK
jgi:hypothetical protein